MTLGPSRAATQALVNATQPFPANGTVLATSDGETLPATLIYPGNAINVAQAPFFAKGDAELLNTGLVSGHDDTDAFAAAAEKALAENVPLVLGGGQNYKISAEIPIGEIAIYGNKANLIAAQSMRSVLLTAGGKADIFDLNVNANQNALSAVLQGTASRYTRCLLWDAVVDGIRLPGTVPNIINNNDKTHLTEVVCYLNGTAFCSAGAGAPSGVRKKTIPGTVAMSGNTITGTGTTWLTDADPTKRLTNWRQGDLVFIGGSSIGYQIQSIDSDTQITTESFASGSFGAGQFYKVCIGDGYHEDEFPDNNITVWDNLWCRNNGGSGAVIAGEAGPSVLQFQGDFNGAYAAVVGHAGGGAPASTSFGQLYSEANGAPNADLLMAHVNGIVIGAMAGSLNEYDSYSPSLIFGSIGTSIQDSGAGPKPIGFPVSRIPISTVYCPPSDPGSTPFTGQIVFWQDVPGNQVVMRVRLPGGGGYKTINLPWF